MADEIRTYEVQIEGFAPVLFCGRTPSQARMSAFHAYTNAYACSFKKFLQIAKVRRVENPPGVGDRIYVLDKPAHRVLPLDSHTIRFMYDGDRRVLCAHHSEVSLTPPTQKG